MVNLMLCHRLSLHWLMKLAKYTINQRLDCADETIRHRHYFAEIQRFKLKDGYYDLCGYIRAS